MIAHLAPARYLCGPKDSDRTLEHVTIFEFMAILGANGAEKANTMILGAAQEHKLLDPTELMSDKAPQDAIIPYPNEVALMERFMRLVEKSVGRLGGKFAGIKATVQEVVAKVKGLVGNSHLFAKTKEQKVKGLLAGSGGGSDDRVQAWRSGIDLKKSKQPSPRKMARCNEGRRRRVQKPTYVENMSSRSAKTDHRDAHELMYRAEHAELGGTGHNIAVDGWT